MEIHVPAVDEWQQEEECGCMVVLQYWQLFHNAQHNKIIKIIIDAYFAQCG